MDKEEAAIRKDILIVLHQKEQPEFVCAELTRHGITTTLTKDVQDAMASMESHINTFVLLDLELEGAASFLERIATDFYDPPPYLLVADDFRDSSARVQTLNLGADSCLGKPVNAREVLAVIRAALRRENRVECVKSAAVIRHGELSIDPLRRIVNMREQLVRLTVKEFDVLHLLASNPGIVFTKSQIYEQVWKEDFKFSTTSVSDSISSLRQKLGLNARDGRYIQTVFGTGYRFVAE